MTKVIRYIVTGVMTTGVNYVVFYLMFYLLHLNSTLSNSFAVFCAVIFAYVSNKIFVFKSSIKSVKGIIKEATAFVASRGFTIVLEIVGVYFLAEVIRFNPMVSKIVISIFVVILNYFVAQFWVFKKSSSSE